MGLLDQQGTSLILFLLSCDNIQIPPQLLFLQNSWLLSSLLSLGNLQPRLIVSGCKFLKQLPCVARKRNKGILKKQVFLNVADTVLHQCLCVLFGMKCEELHILFSDATWWNKLL